MFSCEIWKNFKNTFFYRTPPVAASEVSTSIQKQHSRGKFQENKVNSDQSYSLEACNFTKSKLNIENNLNELIIL